jgi:DNA polymerase-3 subunit epsilon
VRSSRSLSSGLCRSCRDADRRGAEADRSRQAIRSLLGRDDVLILDTETTGMGEAEVIELSVIDTRGELLLDTLVKPRRRSMNPYAQRVHGITFAMLEDAPTWPQVLPELQRLVDRSTVLAWNAPFDARMLEQTSEGWGLVHPRILFVCAMRLYAGLHLSRRHALHKAVAEQGLSHLLERHRSHRALGDVTFVLEVLRSVVDTPSSG